jgi:putative inorganic carbon (hco3(-)) transporter
MGFFFFLIYLALMFLRPAELAPRLESYQIMDIASGAAIVGAVFGLVTGRGPSLRAPQLYLAPLFMLWAGVSLVLSQHWIGGMLGVLFEFLRASGLVFLLVVLNVDSIARFRATVAVLGLLAVVLVVEGAAAYHFGWRADQLLLTQSLDEEDALEMTDAPPTVEDGARRSRATEGPVAVRVRSLGFLNDPNDLAQALVALLPLVVSLREPERRVRNLLFVWIPVAVLLYGIFLTRSRGGLLALLVMLLFALRRRMGRTMALAVSVVAVLGLVALGATGGRALAKDESGAGRIEAWSEGLEMLKTSPLWGIGFESFTDYHDLVAHNSFVHCFAELGLIGYFFWLALIVLTWVGLSTVLKGLDDAEARDIQSACRALRLALVGFFVGCLFLSRSYGVMLFLMLGLGTALGDIARREGLLDRQEHVVRWLGRIGAIEAVSIVLVWIAVRVAR